LVSLIITRVLDGGDLLPHVLLLDRTCLGVKNAMLLAPMTDDELDEIQRAEFRTATTALRRFRPVLPAAACSTAMAT
jgi:hypothetical protein